MVICELLGVPAADRAWVKDKIDTTFHIEPGVGMVNDVSLTARIELDGYLTGLLTDAGRRHRATTCCRACAQADLTLREGADFANLLVSAGTETVARLLGWAAVVLDEHPDQRAELVADPSLVPNAVEELLRYEAPSPVQGRWTSRPVELHGIDDPGRGQGAAAHRLRGPRRAPYPDADRFDVHRRFDQHVSFGYGIHFCLGAVAGPPRGAGRPGGGAGPPPGLDRSTASGPCGCTPAPCGAGRRCRCADAAGGTEADPW